MEKRALLFLIIALIFFVFYSHLLTKITPPPPTPKSSKMISKPPVVKEITLSSPEVFKEVNLDNFVVTFSLTGGYIKKIFIKRYQEMLLFDGIGTVSGYENTNFELTQENNKITLFSPQKKVVKEFIFKGYLLQIKIKTPRKSKVVLLRNLLDINKLNQRYQEVFYRHNEKIVRLPFRRVKPTLIKSNLVGTRDRYFCFVVFRENPQEVMFLKEKKAVELVSETEKEAEFTIFIGPQSYKLLAQYDLEEIINYGFFHGISILLIKFLYLFLSFTKNWGVSIILLSITIYLCLFPFTAKSTKAMKKIQELQPKIEALKLKYKDNPQKLNKELLELYREYRVNPLGGCLPLFFQLPVFFALYQVLLRFVELKGARFLWIKDLSLPDRAFHLKVNLPFFGEYINILPLLIVLLGLLQQNLTQTQQSQQKQMGLFFVVFIGIIFYQFPSGLVLYWLTQNILTLIYQWRISRT